MVLSRRILCSPQELVNVVRSVVLGQAIATRGFGVYRGGTSSWPMAT